MLGDTESPPLTMDVEVRYIEAVRQEREYRNAQAARQRQPNTIPNEMLRHYFQKRANE